MHITDLFWCGLFLALLGCAPVETMPEEDAGPSALIPCTEQAKLDRCTRDRDGNVAMCYTSGFGPEPIEAPSELWPKYGCAAPKDNNIMGRLGWWEWWCCSSEAYPPDAGTD